MRVREPRLHFIILPLAALIAVTPLMLNGCSCGHDFDFHILNWFEVARQFLHGNFHPHWAYTPAWNAGEPRFIFYPPLSWIIGAVLGLIMPWTWTPIAYTWLALTAAGLALHYLARDFTTRNAALIAAALYIVNPYTLFTAYERTAYAELLAAAWIPLLIHAILRERVTIPRIAIPVALLWLTDAPAAVMGCYALALLTLIRLATNSGAPIMAQPHRDMIGPSQGAPFVEQSHRATGGAQPPLQLLLNAAAGALLGLGLAAIYILPAAWERRFVHINMVILPEMNIHDNFLFHHTPDLDHDLVLRTASIIALILIAITIAALALAYWSNRKSAARSATDARVLHPSRSHREGRNSSIFHSHLSPGASLMRSHRMGGLIPPLAILTAVIIFLLTPISAPIWDHTPEMAYMQFPWRLLAILAAVMALAIAITLSHANLKSRIAIALALITAAALIALSYPIFKQDCDDPDTVSARLALFHSNQGTDPSDEYTPIAADNDALAQNNPPFWLAQDPAAKAPSNSTPGPAPTHLDLALPAHETLILNLRDYPTWRITRNGAPVTTREQRDDGLIAFPIPAGKSSIAITYAQPLDQTLGDILTAISAAVLLLFFCIVIP